MKSYQILPHLLLLFNLIHSESTITERGSIQVENGKHTIPISGNRLLTWDKSIVQLDSHIIYRKSEGQIINVMSNSIGQDPAAVIMTGNSHQKNTFSILLMDDGGKVNAFKTIQKPFDEGIPAILFADSDLLFIKPEEQIIQVYHYDGSKESEYHLFDKPSWSHEKRIMSSKDSSGNYYFLGMRSADLKNRQNISLFKMETEVNQLIDLPLTIPYFFEISTNNITAVVGTKGEMGTFQQLPFLIFLDNDQQIINQPVKLKKLPQKTIWFGDELLLIYRDRIIIYSADANKQPGEIQLNSQLYPFESFIVDESLFILSGREIGADQHGNFYRSINSVEYNNKTHSVSIHALQDGSIRKVEYFPAETSNEFYLRLDNKLVQFRISK